MDESELRDRLDQRAGESLFSGVAMAWSGGEQVFAHAAGLAHRGLQVPVGVATRFQVASVTKMVTAATALRLVEQGRLELHSPLVDALPEALRPSALTRAHTLHHLLSHTSGLANYHDDDDETWESFTSCWDRVPPHRVRRPSDMLPLFADLPAVFPPGSAFQYGDSNYLLVGILIEQVTGGTYGDVVTSEVLEPAGMSDSGFADLDLTPEGLATGYLVTDDPPDTWRSNLYSVPVGGLPDGGLISTAADLCRFIDALEDDRLLAPDTREAMLRPYGSIDEGIEEYGYGMEMVRTDGRLRIFGHSGSDPGVSTMVSRFVDEAVTVVVLCNHDRGSWAVSQRLAEWWGADDPRE